MGWRRRRGAGGDRGNRKEGKLLGRRQLRIGMVSVQSVNMMFITRGKRKVSIPSISPKFFGLRNMSIKMHLVLNIDLFEQVIIIMTRNSCRIDPTPLTEKQVFSAAIIFSSDFQLRAVAPSAISYCQYFLSLT